MLINPPNKRDLNQNDSPLIFCPKLGPVKTANGSTSRKECKGKCTQHSKMQTNTSLFRTGYVQIKNEGRFDTICIRLKHTPRCDVFRVDYLRSAMCLMALIHDIPDHCMRFWNNAIEILMNKMYILNPMEMLHRFQSNSSGVYFWQSTFLLLPFVMF